jgi:hypothetical protein
LLIPDCVSGINVTTGKRVARGSDAINRSRWEGTEIMTVELDKGLNSKEPPVEAVITEMLL